MLSRARKINIVLTVCFLAVFFVEPTVYASPADAEKCIYGRVGVPLYSARMPRGWISYNLTARRAGPLLNAQITSLNKVLSETLADYTDPQPKNGVLCLVYIGASSVVAKYGQNGNQCLMTFEYHGMPSCTR